MKCGNILERLVRKALKSPCTNKVGAIGLDRRGRPIGIAFNTFRFARRGGGVHAEMKVMMKSPKSLRKIVIVRVNSKGNVRPIHPCEICSRKARDLGVIISSYFEPES